MHQNTDVSFFLGANSANGFVSRFSNVYNLTDGWRVYIIKGGPGTGKSSLMKKLASSAKERGFTPQLCYCSSDPVSLDAVIIPENKFMIADGTAPHGRYS